MYDAHCHQTDPAAYQEARAAGIDGWLWAALEPADPAPSGVWRAYGLHPWNALEHDRAWCENALELLDHRLQTERPEAVGEIGLDFFRATTPAARSHARWVFEQQLELAGKHNLPVVVHSVRCHSEMTRLLRHANLSRAGIMHAFFGPPKAYREMGYLLSLGPHSLEGAMPKEGILLETDAPARDATLTDLVRVAQTVAERLGLEVLELTRQCDAALRKCLGLD